MNKTGSVNIKIRRMLDDEFSDAEDRIAIEEPMEIRLQYGENALQVQECISVTMRTPGQDEQLAAGFLFTEGILSASGQIKMITPGASGRNVVLVILKENILPSLQNSGRNFYITSSCGVCGKASIDAIKQVSKFANEPGNIVVASSVLYGLQDKLKLHQKLFEHTGGIHACGLFTCNGEYTGMAEDVGRHNALDKLIGDAFLKNNLPLSGYLLLLSGRASFELVQKAHMAGIKIIAAVGAPSSLAVELAKENDITLIGFLRGNRFNVYCGEQRLE